MEHQSPKARNAQPLDRLGHRIANPPPIARIALRGEFCDHLRLAGQSLVGQAFPQDRFAGPVGLGGIEKSHAPRPDVGNQTSSLLRRRSAEVVGDSVVHPQLRGPQDPRKNALILPDDRLHVV